MKKFIFAVVMLFVVIPFSVNAEECTDEMVASYLPQANSVYMKYVATSNPDTYKIFVYGLSTGISYDGINGTEFNDGYYAYASAGNTFTISVKISDGSICALKTIKMVSISVPANTTVIQPVVEPTTPSTPTTPSINNNNSNDTSTNSPATSPSTNITSGSTSSSTTSGKTNSDTVSIKPTTDVKTNEDTSDDTDLDSEKTKEIEETKEVLTTNDNNKNKDNSIIKYSIASAIIILMISSGIIIYFKNVKGAKK